MSDAELELLKSLSSHWYRLVTDFDDLNQNPVTVWFSVVRDIFMEGRTGPEVEALRRVVNALSKCEPYRSTPEFDALCALDYKESVE